MARSVGSIFAKLGLVFDDFDRDVAKAQRKFRTMGRDFSRIGNEINTKVSLPIAAIGAASLKAQIDFESAFAGVRKTVDVSDAKFKELTTGIKNMSKEIPASVVQISAVAEAAGQLGIESDNILGFTRTMVDLGEATNLSANEAATALARFANITKMSQKDFDRLGSAIVGLGNNFATTEAEIVEMSLRIAGAASVAGFSEPQMLGFATALSSVGVNAEAGGTAISTFIKKVQTSVETGNSSLAKFAKVANLSVGEFTKLFEEDAARAISSIIEGFGRTKERSESVLKVFSELGLTEKRLSDSLLRLSGNYELLNRALAQGVDDWTQNKALAEEVARRYETMASKLSMVWNQVVLLGAEIGEILMPALNRFLELTKSMVSWFSNLDQQTKTIIVAIGGITVAVGAATTAIGALLTLIGTKGILIFGAVAAAVSGLTAGFITFQDEITSAWEAAATFFGDLSSFASQVGAAWLSDINAQIDELKEKFSGLIVVIEYTSEAIIRLRDAVGLLTGNSDPARFEEVGQRIKDWAASAIGAIPAFRDLGKQWDDLTADFNEHRGERREFERQLSEQQAGIKKLIDELGGYDKAMAKIGQAAKSGLSGMLKILGADGIAGAFGVVLEGAEKTGEAIKGAAGETEGLALGGDKASKAFESLSKELSNIESSNALSSINKEIERAIQNGSKENLVKWFDSLREETRRGIEAGFLADGGVLNEAAAAKIDALVNEKINPQFADASQRFADGIEEKTKKAYKESVNYYTGLMEDAITGTRFDWENQMKKAAASFIAELLAGFDEFESKSNNIFGKIFDFGAEKISSIFGDGQAADLSKLDQDKIRSSIGELSSQGKSTDWLSSLLGSGSTAEEPIATSVKDGSGLTASQLDSLDGGGKQGSMGASAAAFIPAILGAYEQGRDIGKNKKETTEGLSTVLAGFIGGYLGGPSGASFGVMLGEKIGEGINSVFNKTGEGTRSRKTAENYLEDRLGVNVLFGDGSQFVPDEMKKSWAETFKDIAGDGQAAFTALGSAIADLSGVSGEYGDQIGFILAQNIGGNIDDLRILTRLLGLDNEMLAQKYEEIGLRGEQSWHQIEVGLQNVNQLTAKGLSGVGDLVGAFDRLTDSGGRGAVSLENLKDIGVEAQEAGAQSLSDIVDVATELGVSQEKAQKLLDALRGRGIGSFEELANASTRVLGGVIADLESMNFGWTEIDKNIIDAVSSMSELQVAIRGLDQKAIDIFVKLHYDEINKPKNLPDTIDVTPFARGGLVDSPTFFNHSGGVGLMGEAGSEFIMPAKRMANGDMGVQVDLGNRSIGGDNIEVHINVNAGNGDSGAIEVLMEGLAQIKQSAASDAVQIVRKLKRENRL